MSLNNNKKNNIELLDNNKDVNNSNLESNTDEKAFIVNNNVIKEKSLKENNSNSNEDINNIKEGIYNYSSNIIYIYYILFYILEIKEELM